MDAIWNTILTKVTTECGIFGVIGWVLLTLVSLRYAKTLNVHDQWRDKVEKSRAEEREKYLELVADANDINRDVAVAVEKMEHTREMMQEFVRQSQQPPHQQPPRRR